MGGEPEVIDLVPAGVSPNQSWWAFDQETFR